MRRIADPVAVGLCLVDLSPTYLVPVQRGLVGFHDRDQPVTPHHQPDKSSARDLGGVGRGRNLSGLSDLPVHEVIDDAVQQPVRRVARDRDVRVVERLRHLRQHTHRGAMSQLLGGSTPPPSPHCTAAADGLHPPPPASRRPRGPPLRCRRPPRRLPPHPRRRSRPVRSPGEARCGWPPARPRRLCCPAVQLPRAAVTNKRRSRK